MFYEKGVLKNFANLTVKHLCWSILLIKLLKLHSKETPTQVFSCQICDIFKKTYCEEHPRTTVSKNGRYYVDKSFQNSEERDLSFLGLKRY